MSLRRPSNPDPNQSLGKLLPITTKPQLPAPPTPNVYNISWREGILVAIFVVLLVLMLPSSGRIGLSPAAMKDLNESRKRFDEYNKLTPDQKKIRQEERQKKQDYLDGKTAPIDIPRGLEHPSGGRIINQY